jgi:diphthine-ammonia ligase
MHVVALVSGGKDSCYSILKCLSHGHDVIALAHITPPLATAEPDSFMYQSIASNAIPALASALNLPLYTRQTSAHARVTSLAYSPTDPSDEVEDLAALLVDVKAAHPELTAVTAGALWSDYQRLRVESAASRAGLVSLAYLWRRDQEALLDEMVANGLRAVLVKVASVGLDERHVGKDLGEMRPLLKMLEERYGCHIAGEGGEYETLVLSLPVFSHEIVLDDPDVSLVCHSEDPVAPVYYLDIARARLQEKKPGSVAAGFHGQIPSPPPVPAALKPIEDDYFPPIDTDKSSAAVYDDKTHVSSHSVGGYVHAVVQCSDVETGTAALRDAINSHCTSSFDALSEALFVWVRLSSLAGDAYAAGNKSYAAAFGSAACTPPPARACVGMRGAGAAVTLEALARPGRRMNTRTTTLHVQSLSEWAPPCIGPYAQTVTDGAGGESSTGRRVFICGVLPLHAPTASIPEGLGGQAQARACMYNMARTLEATTVGLEQLVLVVAYVVDKCLGRAVEQEVRAAGFDSPIAIVAVDSLPKAALVEIRAVAVEKDVDDADENVGEDRSEDAGNLSYMVVESYSGEDEIAGDILLQLGGRVDNVLSMQVFVSGGGRELVRAGLTVRFDAALLVADVGWLANDGATAMCIATLVC